MPNIINIPLSYDDMVAMVDGSDEVGICAAIDESRANANNLFYLAALKKNIPLLNIIYDTYDRSVVHVNAKNFYGLTTFFAAVSSGDIGVVRWFLDRGANAMQYTNFGHSLLHCASQQEVDVDIWYDLIAHGASINITDDNNQTPLHGDYSLLHYALMIPDDADHKTLKHDTILYLIEHGCTLYIPEECMDPLLDYAQKYSNMILRLVTNTILYQHANVDKVINHLEEIGTYQTCFLASVIQFAHTSDPDSTEKQLKIVDNVNTHTDFGRILMYFEREDAKYYDFDSFADDYFEEITDDALANPCTSIDELNTSCSGESNSCDMSN